MSNQYALIKNGLRALLNGTLPGKEAQYEMATIPRKYLDKEVPALAITAAVLILLYQKNDVWHTVYIRRVQHKKDQHSGQISFPGGKKEIDDLSIAATALRETEEEIGVIKDRTLVLGHLSSFYIPISGFDVHPVVGIIDYEPIFTPQIEEVAHVIEAPLRALIDPNAKQKKNILARDQVLLKDTPYYNVQGEVIWGATAMITNELVHLLSTMSDSF